MNKRQRLGDTLDSVDSLGALNSPFLVREQTFKPATGELMQRIADFLPQIQHANQQPMHSMEQVDGDNYIQMDLGLGVYDVLNESVQQLPVVQPALKGVDMPGKVPLHALIQEMMPSTELVSQESQKASASVSAAVLASAGTQDKENVNPSHIQHAEKPQEQSGSLKDHSTGKKQSNDAAAPATDKTQGSDEDDENEDDSSGSEDEQDDSEEEYASNYSDAESSYAPSDASFDD